MPADPRRVKDLFVAAIDLADASERAEMLDRECGGDVELRQQVVDLLAAHDAPHAALNQPLAAAPDLTGAYASQNAAQSETIGSILAGKYKLLQEVGEGGMGSVFMADQLQPVKRRVAVKVIKAGMDSARVLARFEAERQALALMDHPNIAKVLDAGATESGRPFFVMELVKGIPLTQFCDQHKLPVLDRLILFMQICSAVQHAHQKGIIHRDLKPTNILVESHDGKPVPKVIDFGLAKATSGIQLSEHTLFTALGQVAGTPLYMAPEQAAFNAVDVDTRADVYALGVILYELLTGTTPIERETFKKAAFDEMMRMIREQEPVTPSSRLSSSETKASVAAVRQTEPAKLGRYVRGELDWIVMKSLSKERDRRYESATAFARDIERFLNHEAVLAGRPSAGYKMRKFVRRNRPQVIASSIVLLALLAGIAGTTFGLVRAIWARNAESEQRQIAEQRERDALKAADEERRAKVREAEQRSNAEKARDRTREVLDAMTSEATGDSLTTQTAITAEQKKFLTEVLSFYKEFSGDSADDERTRFRTAAAAFKVGMIEFRLGHSEESAKALRLSCDSFIALSVDYPAVPKYRQYLAESHNMYGNVLVNRMEAVTEHRRALAIREKLAADFPDTRAYREELAKSHNNLANVLKSLGRLSEAEAEYRVALAMLEKLATDRPDVAIFRELLGRSHTNLGTLLAEFGRLTEAEAEFRLAVTNQEVLAARYVAMPNYREVLAISCLNLGGFLSGIGKHKEAEEQLRKSMANLDKLVANYPVASKYRHYLAVCRRALGGLFTRTQKWSEAESEYRFALTILEQLIADFPADRANRVELAQSHFDLGVLFKEVDKVAEAESEYRMAVTIQEKLVADFPETPAYRQVLAKSHNNLGSLFNRLGKHVDAEVQYRKALAIQEALAARFPDMPGYRQNLAMTQINLGELFAMLGKREEGRSAYLAALDIQKKLVGSFPAVLTYQASLGNYYLHFGKMIREDGKQAESLNWFNLAIETLQHIHEKDPRDVKAKLYLRDSHTSRAGVHDALKKPVEAIKDWQRAIELSQPAEHQVLRANRAISTLHAGTFAEALAEVAELTKSSNWNAGQWYDFACVYSVASAKIADKKQEYADRAIELLHKAVKTGFNDAAHMAKDTDLDPLRDRDDFKKLMTDLETKSPPKPQLAPPPREVKP